GRGPARCRVDSRTWEPRGAWPERGRGLVGRTTGGTGSRSARHRSVGSCVAELYNHERLHQSLGYRAPAEMYGGGARGAGGGREEPAGSGLGGGHHKPTPCGGLFRRPLDTFVIISPLGVVVFPTRV